MFWFHTLVEIFLLSNFSQGISANVARYPRSLRVERDAEDEGGEEYKVCLMKIDRDTASALDKPDERADFTERKICNLLTNLEEECGKVLVDNGFSEDRVLRILDGTIKNLMNGLLAPFVRGVAWDLEKCPVVKTYTERMACEAEYQSCFDRTLDEYLENISNLEKNFDWRANYVERKSCNMVTGVSECKQLMKDCHSDEFIKKEWDTMMELVIEKTKAYPAWDSQKCPVVKEYLEQKAAAKETSTTSTPSTPVTEIITSTTRRPIIEQRQGQNSPVSGAEYLRSSTATIIMFIMVYFLI